jgi:nucleoside-diphosphate-sugar epimerase
MSEHTLHTVLGASGSVGRTVIAALLEKGMPIRAVSRSLDMPGISAVPADLLDPDQADTAIRGSSHVYLCVGLPYYYKVWKDGWLQLMSNVITACEHHNARLIFLDNVYLYGPGPLAVPFGENHPQQPDSKKGKVRKRTADLLMNAFKAGRIQGVVGRSADFYGPNTPNSMLYILFLERMLKGRSPQFIGSPGQEHTFSDVRDIGRALVELALAEDTYGDVWHLPVGKPIKIEEVVEIYNQLLGTNHKVTFMPKWLRTLIGWFVPALREVNEMAYQFDHPYVMSDQKFRNRFPDFEVTTYEEGLKNKVQAYR